MKTKIKILLASLLSIALNAYAASAQPIIAQYYGIWTETGQTWEQKFRSDTPFDKLNRLYIAFGKVVTTPDGHHTLDFDGSADRVMQIVKRVKEMNPNADILLTVGGDDKDDSFGGAGTDPLFAANAMSFLKKYGFNGMDIDWELYLDRDKLDNLLTSVYPAFHDANFLFTMDVYAVVHPYYDLDIIQKNVDQINIMSYGTGWDLKGSVELYSRLGFPIYKMIGGVETENGFQQNKGFTDTLGYTGSIYQKATYVKKNNLAGIMEWRLGNDYAINNNTYPTYAGAYQLWRDMQD